MRYLSSRVSMAHTIPFGLLHITPSTHNVCETTDWRQWRPTGFESIEGQLPKFDIDKHGNRLDKPLDPYGKTVLLYIDAKSSE